MRVLSFLKRTFFSKQPQRALLNHDKEILNKKWSEIEQMILLGRPSNFKQAVIEADKLLDYTLEKMGYNGSLGEKLKKARERFSKAVYNEIWEAHRIRNKLVHQMDAEILSFQAKNTIKKIKRGLKELGVL